MKKRGRIQRSRKAVSPVISTVLLITIVIILAVIIFLWASKFVEEAIEKEVAGVKKTVDKFCTEVDFKASIVDSKLFIVNEGNIPIYEINIKKKTAGTTIVKNYTIDLDAASTSDGIPLEEVGLDTGYDEVTIIPTLLGKAGNKKKKYNCPESVGVKLEE